MVKKQFFKKKKSIVIGSCRIRSSERWEYIYMCNIQGRVYVNENRGESRCISFEDVNSIRAAYLSLFLSVNFFNFIYKTKKIKIENNGM